jgi:hypothetical protein
MKLNRNVFAGSLMMAALMGILLLGGCGNKPAYYAGQKQTDALKAAVTRDVFVLVHCKGEAAQTMLEEAKKANGDSEKTKNALKALMDFTAEYKLQQAQLTIEDIEKEALVVAATFEKKIDADELKKLLKKLFGDDVVKEKDDGEFELNGDGLAILTGKGKVLYLGSKSMAREVAEAYKKGQGVDLPEDATSALRKGDDIYAVALRNDYVEKEYKNIPKEMRKMIGALPKSLGLSVNLAKGAQLIANYDDKDEAKEGVEAVQGGLKLAKEMELPAAVEELRKSAEVKTKDKGVTVTVKGDILKTVVTLLQDSK